MPKENVCVRLEKETVTAIDTVVNVGIYKDRTAFIIDAIEEKLNPEKVKGERVNRIVYELKNNPEIRAELLKIIQQVT